MAIQITAPVSPIASQNRPVKRPEAQMAPRLMTPGWLTAAMPSIGGGDMMDVLAEIARAGLDAVWDYVALHVLTCLVPAFLLAGAMVAFINKEAIMARLGAAASKPAGFATPTGASFFLAACSCTVIPVSGGIYYSGAGIGAAFIL